MLKLAGTAAALLLVCLSFPGQVAASNGPKDDARLEPPAISAREGGARYGQAAGAALVCFGVRVTDRVEKLRARYTGQDLAEFDREARKIAEAWTVTLSCEKADGPNQCRLTHVWSCQQAMREIGPNGTAARGLIAPR